MNRFSVKTVFVFALMTVLVTTIFVTTAIHVFQEYETIDNKFRERLIQEAGEFQGIISDALRQGNKPLVRRLIASMSGRVDLRAAWASDSRGRIIAAHSLRYIDRPQKDLLAEFGLPGANIQKQRFFQKDDLLVVRFRLLADLTPGKIRPDRGGDFFIIYSTRGAKDEAFYSALFYALMNGLLTALLLLTVFAIMFRSINFRLSHILKAIEYFSAGDRQVRFLVEGHDEIAQIGSTLDGMAKKISRDEQSLKTSQERLQLAVENTRLGLWDWRIPTNQVIFNEGWCRLLGWSLAEIRPELREWEERLHPEDRQMVMDALNRHLAGDTEYYEARYRLATRLGGWKWVLDRGRVVEWDQEGKAARAAGTIQDITVEINYQKQIEELVRTDGLTGLFNRRHFDAVFPIEINRARRDGRNFCFLMFDIDFFKHYNDTYGHPAGDVALEKTGQLVRETFRRSGDMAFRLGGEEFGIILNCGPHSNCESICAKLLDRVKALEIEHRGSKVSPVLTISIGCVWCPPDKIPVPDALYKQTDEALYQAKREGRNRYIIIKR